MRNLLFTALLATATGLLASAPRAVSQPEESFGVLKTSPHPTQGTPAGSPGLPRGVEPVRHSTSAAPVPVAPNPYPLKADAGAWLICAAAYSGPDGAELARQVCVFLREQHRLQAFIFNRGAEERRKQDEEWERIRQANPNTPMRRRRVRYEDHYAVLVSGGWQDFKAASDHLARIKALPIPKLQLDGGKSAYEMMTYQETDPKTKKPVIKRAPISPFHNAMVTRNPLAAESGPAKPKWDPYWVKLNADEEYSLLKSKSQITLLVKEYTGGQVLQSRQSSGSLLESIFGPKQGEALAAAAAQAHELARFLTKQNLGHKTFVLHTRNASIVTVGEFQDPNDPNLPRTMKLLSSLSFKDKNTGVDPIGLLPNPVPIVVPRPDR